MSRNPGRNLRIVMLGIVLSLAAPSSLFAHNRSASVMGIVKDSTGAVLPGATVTVRAVATNQSRQTVSDECGRYAFPKCLRAPAGGEPDHLQQSDRAQLDGWPDRVDQHGGPAGAGFASNF